MSVTNAPQNAPDRGVAAAFVSVARSPEPASPLRPVVMTLIPSRNRPTPPRTAIVVDIRQFLLLRVTLRVIPSVTPVSKSVLHEAELTGAESRLGAIADVEFSKDVSDVVLDGAFGEVEAIGDFLVRGAAAEQ